LISIAKLVFSTTAVHMQRSSPIDAGGRLWIAAHVKASLRFIGTRSKTELSPRPKTSFFVAEAQKACLFVAQPCAMQGYLPSRSLEHCFHWENSRWNSISKGNFGD
jgi:hypothetical protein